jgi:hypothetical protein
MVLMNLMKAIHTPVKDILRIILISSIIFLFTFPRLEPDFGPGLDSSYVWAFNHLFANDYGKLTDLIYPFGPLGFLKMPVPIGDNLEIGLLVFSILKLLFMAALLAVFHSARDSASDIIISAIIVLLISYVSDIDLIITGLCVVSGIIFLRNHKMIFILAAALLGTMGFCIKASIGVNSFTVTAGIIILSYVTNKDLKRFLLLIIITLALIFISGLAVFGNLKGFPHYLYNSARLITDYSTALAIYPENNWIALGIFIISVIIFPVVAREKEVVSIWFILLLPIFIIWKHSITREDITHNRIMLYFLIFYWGLLTGILKEKKLFLLLIPVISILAFYRNMANIQGYSGYKIEIAGINNFYSSIIDLPSFRKKYQELSVQNLEASKLSQDLTGVIGNSTIDFYPWELSYVPANGLNWLPRKTLQSGSFSRWLDRQSASSLEKTTPEYLLFHYPGGSVSGRFDSFDQRYLLNDEPITIITILNKFSPEILYDKFVLLKRVSSDRLSEPVETGRISTEWNTWIDVPEFGESIGRVKFTSKINLLGGIKQVFYKGDACYIDYQFGENQILTYRFNQLNAKDGLWLNPFYRSSLVEIPKDKVKKIRFRNSSARMFSPVIRLEFESYNTR